MPTTDAVKRLPSGKLKYRGVEFPGYNKPKVAPAGAKQKKIVLAKKGDQVKVVRFGYRGMEDFTQHGDPARRKNFRERFAGIKTKDGKRAIDQWDSPARWALKELW